MTEQLMVVCASLNAYFTMWTVNLETSCFGCVIFSIVLLKQGLTPLSETISSKPSGVFPSFLLPRGEFGHP